MIAFARADNPTQHSGVQRAGNGAAAVQRTGAGFDGARGAASRLLAAAASALRVAANRVVDTWANDHLIAAWMMLWVIAFAGIARPSAPARRAEVALRAAGARWAENRRRAIEDDKLWQLVLADRRAMADISHAIGRRAVDGIRLYL